MGETRKQKNNWKNIFCIGEQIKTTDKMETITLDHAYLQCEKVSAILCPKPNTDVKCGKQMIKEHAAQ